MRRSPFVVLRVSLLSLVLLASASLAQGPLTPLPWLDAPAIDKAAQQGPVKVGDELNYTAESPVFRGPEARGVEEMVWQEELVMPFASYIAPHFERFELPAGARLVVRAPDHSRSWTYTGYGKSDRPIEDGFWGIHIAGELAIVELYSRVALEEGVVTIDRFAHGFPIGDGDYQTEAICGSDDSGWAKCYQTSEATIYNESRAVARLLINGSSACTGWLVGDEGHLMTNEHCIGNSSSALNTNYEFLAEGANCSTSCASWGACPGIVEATSATLVQLDAALDYALVQLPTNLTGTYGFMQLRDTGAVVNERIYIPQHPAHWGKKIGVTSSHSSDGSGFCEVFSLNQPACSGGSADVGYYCDTQGGSSGSPVLGYDDHLVVALHHCANCPNRGVPIEAIISDLGSNLPNNAIGGGGGGGGQPCAECLDLDNFTFTGYSNQDTSNGTVAIQDNGGTYAMTGNRWRRTTQTFDVTANTVVEVEFRSTSQGEIHGIGFDENDTLTDAVRIFQLHGTQNWGSSNHDFDNYSSGTQSYTIPVGQYYTGSAMYLVLVNDDDANSAGNGWFTDIKVYESGGGGGGGCTVDQDFEANSTGWANDPASTCTTGDYVRGNPTVQTNSGVTTQVGGSNSGSNSLFTATNTSAGTNDVDGGNCILSSPSWSVANASTLSVAYWHGQRDAGDDASGDFFRLEVSTNGGSSWSTLASNGDSTSNAAWATANAQIPAGSNVELRVQCSDGAGPGDLVECGIDDVSICDN